MEEREDNRALYTTTAQATSLPTPLRTISVGLGTMGGSNPQVDPVIKSVLSPKRVEAFLTIQRQVPLQRAH